MTIDDMVESDKKNRIIDEVMTSWKYWLSISINRIATNCLGVTIDAAVVQNKTCTTVLEYAKHGTVVHNNTGSTCYHTLCSNVSMVM